WPRSGLPPREGEFSPAMWTSCIHSWNLSGDHSLPARTSCPGEWYRPPRCGRCSDASRVTASWRVGEGMRRRRAHLSTDLRPLYETQAGVAVRPLRQSRRLRRVPIVLEPRRTPCTDITDF